VIASKRQSEGSYQNVSPSRWQHPFIDWTQQHRSGIPIQRCNEAGESGGGRVRKGHKHFQGGIESISAPLVAIGLIGDPPQKQLLTRVGFSWTVYKSKLTMSDA